jgi:hypothetical protein
MLAFSRHYGYYAGWKPAVGFYPCACASGFYLHSFLLDFTIILVDLCGLPIMRAFGPYPLFENRGLNGFDVLRFLFGFMLICVDCRYL